MSRSALVVAAVLFALGAVVWLQTRDEPPEPARAPAATPSSPTAPSMATPDPAVRPAPVAVPLAAPGAPPRIATRDELLQALKARGYEAEKMLAAYRDWRVARGFLGADPLTGTTAENSPSQTYAAMDRATQKSLADSGDLGAMQAYAAGSLPADPPMAVEYYARAAEMGSAAAMVEIAKVLADVGALDPGGPGTDPTYPQRLLALRGGDPLRDLRQDAMAWTLAAIRLHGPIVATPAALAQTGELERSHDKALLATVCGKSLAILADLSAATVGRDTTSLPPVFITEKNLYDRLPCRDTPAPVTPPRALEACRSSPAVGSNSQPVELWICQGN